ncbi:MAG: DUF262 domain-containing protein [Bacteroidales bacterium]
MKTTFWKLLDQYKITIPIIQRDYAQGRMDKKVTLIRKELLNTIKCALDKKSSVDFDFVYGTSNNGFLYPLDGQQRLTTLFLLHWYFATKGGLLNEKVKGQLKKFSYQTRISSQRFCEKIVEFTPSTDELISVIIKDQPWFAMTWNNDPTIVAMLNMLDDIQVHYSAGVNQYKEWFEVLTNQEIIHFQFLDMDSFNLSDDLYIKMNARGKPLTDFENFKARFEKYLTDTAREEEKKRFVDHADGVWTDLFWKEMSNKMDVGFMRYFDFIAEVGFHILNLDNEKLIENDNELKFKVFKNNDILNLLFDSLDAWCEIESKSNFFCNYFTGTKYEVGRVKLYEENVNLFERCLQGINFVAKDKLMLYAVVLQLISKQDKTVELRLIRNLLINSPYEIRADNMNNLFCSIRNIMGGNINYIELKNTFSGPQVDDEKVKAEFIQNYKELAEELYHFEDHYILKGRMSAIELDPRTLKQNREIFAKLFDNNVDRNTISRAMLCFGDYSQGNGDRWRFANSDDSWHSILTSADVSKVKGALNLLLESMKNCSLEDIISNKISGFTIANNLPWEYYFIQYPEMNQGASANYVWYSDFNICMLNTTRLSGYWRDPYLWSVCCQFTKNDREKINNIYNLTKDKQPIDIFGIELSMCDDGWKVRINSTDNTTLIIYQSIGAKYGIIDDVIKVPANVDRIEIGVNIVRDIISQL